MQTWGQHLSACHRVWLFPTYLNHRRTLFGTEWSDGLCKRVTWTTSSWIKSLHKFLVSEPQMSNTSHITPNSAYSDIVATYLLHCFQRELASCTDQAESLHVSVPAGISQALLRDCKVGVVMLARAYLWPGNYCSHLYKKIECTDGQKTRLPELGRGGIRRASNSRNWWPQSLQGGRPWGQISRIAVRKNSTHWQSTSSHDCRYVWSNLGVDTTRDSPSTSQGLYLEPVNPTSLTEKLQAVVATADEQLQEDFCKSYLALTDHRLWWQQWRYYKNPAECKTHPGFRNMSPAWYCNSHKVSLSVVQINQADVAFASCPTLALALTGICIYFALAFTYGFNIPNHCRMQKTEPCGVHTIFAITIRTVVVWSHERHSCPVVRFHAGYASCVIPCNAKPTCPNKRFQWVAGHMGHCSIPCNLHYFKSAILPSPRSEDQSPLLRLTIQCWTVLRHPHGHARPGTSNQQLTRNCCSLGGKDSPT